MLVHYLINSVNALLKKGELNIFAPMKRLLVLFLLPLQIFGQTNSETDKIAVDDDHKKSIKERKELSEHRKDTTKEEKPGNFNVVLSDERINILDEYVKENPLRLTGFRIQLVFGNRSTVNNAKPKFYGNYSGVTVYESYLAPNFRLRAGDFLTRLQAEEFLNQVKGSFPGAYIVNDKINVPSYLKNDFE